MDIQAHRIQRAWRILPNQWRSLPRRERAELLAIQMLYDQALSELTNEIIDKLPGEFGLLAQIMVMLNG